MATAKHSYLGSSKERPKEVPRGGIGLYCCVPTCGNATYNADKEKTGIGLFTILKDEQLRRKCVAALSNYRRKGGADSFNINSKNTVVCEFHFNMNKIKVSCGSGRKTLAQSAVPSIFKFKQQPATRSKRKSPKKRQFNAADVSFDQEALPTLDNQVNVTNNDNADGDEFITCQDCKDLDKKLNNMKLIGHINEEEHVDTSCENIFLKEETEKLNRQLLMTIYSYENVSLDEALFQSTTGLQLSSFEALFSFLDVGEHCQNLIYHDPRRNNEENIQSSVTLNKRGPKPTMNGKNQLFMLLSWLKNGFSLSHTSWLFRTPKSTVSRYLITWINYMYIMLGSIPIWPSKEMIAETMPESFKRTYPTTRCILDCTELFCQSPSSLRMQSKLFSQYKHHVTYKGLVGISPAGSIAFISQLYDGCTSDKEIVSRSGFLDSRLWSPGDSVMADRGFTIEDDLLKISVELNIPAFLGGRDQLTKAEVKESQYEFMSRELFNV